VGASSLRLIRQLLTEGLVLAVPSAALGFCVAWFGSRVGVRTLYSILPSEFARQLRILPIHLDWRVFSFILIAACFSTLAFALAPALQATRGDLFRAARGDFASRHRTGRLRNILVAAQVAICVMLVICSGILLRSGRQVEVADVGLDVRHVIEIDTRQDLRAKVTAILASNSSVESQAAVWHPPLYGNLRGISVAPQEASRFIYAGFNFVAPEYFAVFRVPIIRGRNFTAAEAREEAPVIIVSEATARSLWPHANALNQTLRIQAPPQAPQRSNDKFPQYTSARVIGIARDVVSGSLAFGVDRTCLYFPANSAASFDYALVVRVRGNPEVVRRSLDTLLAAAVPDAVTQMIPMEQVLDVQYFPFHALAWVSEALGALALALTAIGIYGVIAHLVAQRSKEIGIRMALGASSRSVIRLVLSQSIRLAAIGLAIGTPVALGIARLAATKLFMFNTLDLPVYAASISIVLAVAALAAAMPARRASRLDPMSILRQD
jgi:predicted permease